MSKRSATACENGTEAADKKSWHKQWHLIQLNACIFALLLFSSSNGYDAALMNSTLALPAWNSFMNRPTGIWLGFINTAFWIGLGASLPVATWASDKFGRKNCTYFGFLLLLIGVALLAGNVPATYILSRFFTGAAAGPFMTAPPLLINETAIPSQRGIANALYMCGYYVGGIMSAFITFGVRGYHGNWSWRIPSVLQLCLPTIAMLGLYCIPESPRWLISVGSEDEARMVLMRTRAGSCSDEAADPIRDEFQQIKDALSSEQANRNTYSRWGILQTAGNRWRLFITISLGVFAQWSGNGVVSYYLPLVLNTVGVTSVTDQTLISGFLQVWNLLFAVGAAFNVDRVGRRTLFLTSAGIMLTGYIIVTALSGVFAATQQPAIGIAVVPFLFVFFAGYDIALTPLLVAYPCEIWPYELRAQGLAIAVGSTVVAACFNSLVNPIALEKLGWKYYIVFLVVLLLYTASAYLFYPETQGYALEDMRIIFDGKNHCGPQSKAQARQTRDGDLERSSNHQRTVAATDAGIV